jgi:hypothetical protein
MVPRVGVKPTRPYGQQILNRMKNTFLDLTERDEAIFNGGGTLQSHESHAFLPNRSITFQKSCHRIAPKTRRAERRCR